MIRGKLFFSLIVLGILLINFVSAGNGSFYIGNKSNPSETYFFVNGTTGLIGIGTTSPSTKLEVMSGISNNEIARFTGTLTARGLQLSSNAVGGTNEVGFNFNAPGAGGNAEISFSTLGVKAMTIYQNQYVGIGTTTPSNTLDVRGQGNFSGTIFINNNTDISLWSSNVSRNWTADAFTAFNSTWDNRGIIALVSANVTSVNSTFNIQQLYNYTASLISNISIYNMQTLANASYLSTYNATYAAINSTYNIQGIYNHSASLVANASIAAMQSLANASYLTTYNATYANYASNVSRNWTLDTFTNWNSTWDESYLIPQINNTLNIQNLYNYTASLISNTSFNQNIVTYNASMLANSPWNSSSTSVYLNNPNKKVGINTSSPSYALEVNGIMKAEAIISSNRNVIGQEYNILFNGDVRYNVSQSGTATLSLPALFDGEWEPSYTATAPTSADPTIILIEDLPNVHIQAGAWVGWSTRYWPPRNFTIEGYDNYSGADTWRTIVNYTSTAYSGSDYLVKIPTPGAYIKLKYTFYNATGTDGRLGISELIFIHPEAARPYTGIAPSTMYEGIGGKVGIGIRNPAYNLEIGNSATALNVSGMLYVNSSNVGIGTSNPLHKLEVDGNIALTNWGSYIQFGSNNPSYRIERPVSTNDLSIVTTNISRIYVEAGGDIGIGTTAPERLLHLNSSNTAATGLVIQNADTGGKSFTLFSTGSAASIGAGKFSIYNGSVHQFAIDGSTGNVGIGTASPTQLLHVEGNANVTRNMSIGQALVFTDNGGNMVFQI